MRPLSNINLDVSVTDSRLNEKSRIVQHSEAPPRELTPGESDRTRREYTASTSPKSEAEERAVPGVLEARGPSADLSCGCIVSRFLVASFFRSASCSAAILRAIRFLRSSSLSFRRRSRRSLLFGTATTPGVWSAEESSTASTKKKATANATNHRIAAAIATRPPSSNEQLGSSPRFVHSADSLMRNSREASIHWRSSRRQSAIMRTCP
mmetsp:Transcript_26822/g.39221  ORF Transcript_26822/g.39221 Transcript_26822/m.39221 type:complete len:209 (-) Transcript_26822:195-821(-)